MTEPSRGIYRALRPHRRLLRPARRREAGRGAGGPAGPQVAGAGGARQAQGARQPRGGRTAPLGQAAQPAADAVPGPGVPRRLDAGLPQPAGRRAGDQVSGRARSPPTAKTPRRPSRTPRPTTPTGSASGRRATRSGCSPSRCGRRWTRRSTTGRAAGHAPRRLVGDARGQPRLAPPAPPAVHQPVDDRRPEPLPGQPRRGGDRSRKAVPEARDAALPLRVRRPPALARQRHRPGAGRAPGRRLLSAHAQGADPRTGLRRQLRRGARLGRPDLRRHPARAGPAGRREDQSATGQDRPRPRRSSATPSPTPRVTGPCGSKPSSAGATPTTPAMWPTASAQPRRLGPTDRRHHAGRGCRRLGAADVRRQSVLRVDRPPDAGRRPAHDRGAAGDAGPVRVGQGAAAEPAAPADDARPAGLRLRRRGGRRGRDQARRGDLLRLALLARAEPPSTSWRGSTTWGRGSTGSRSCGSRRSSSPAA